MSELPIGWVETTIGEVAPYVSRGRSPKYADRSDLPVINQKAVRWLGIEEQHLKFVDPTTWHQWDADRFVRRGDVLWNSTGTGTIGRATIFTGLPSFDRAVVDSHVTIVRPGPAVEPRYLFSFIRSPTVQDQIADMQSGSTNQGRAQSCCDCIDYNPAAAPSRTAADRCETLCFAKSNSTRPRRSRSHPDPHWQIQRISSHCRLLRRPDARMAGADGIIGASNRYSR